MLESFEKQLKEKADQQIDHSGAIIWDDLAKAIRPEKKRRRLFLWLLLGGLLISGGAFGIYYLDQNSDNSSDQTALISKEDAAIQKPISKSQDKLPEAAINSNEDNLNSENKVNSSVQKDANAQLIKVDGETETNFPAEKKNNLFSSSVKKSSPLRNSPVNSDLKNGNKISLKESGTNERRSIAPSDDASTPVLIDRAKTENIHIDLADEPIITGHTDLKGLDFLPTMIAEIQTSESLTKLLSAQVKCPTFSKKKTAFYLELEGMAGMPVKYLNSKSEATKLYQLRKETEKPWFSWGAGMHAGLVFKDKFSIGTGVDFVQIKEKFDYSKSEVVDLIYHVNPNTGEVTGPYVVKGFRRSSGEITHNLIDIPLNLGFQTSSDKWNLGVQAGPVFNINLTSKGKIMFDTDSISRIQNEEIYVDRLRFGLQGSLMVSRKIGSNFSIYARPSFKYYMNNWNNENYPIDTRFHLLSLNIGLRLTI